MLSFLKKSSKQENSHHLIESHVKKAVEGITSKLDKNSIDQIICDSESNELSIIVTKFIFHIIDNSSGNENIIFKCVNVLYILLILDKTHDFYVNALKDFLPELYSIITLNFKKPHVKYRDTIHKITLSIYCNIMENKPLANPNNLMLENLELILGKCKLKDGIFQKNEHADLSSNSNNYSNPPEYENENNQNDDLIDFSNEPYEAPETSSYDNQVFNNFQSMPPIGFQDDELNNIPINKNVSREIDPFNTSYNFANPINLIKNFNNNSNGNYNTNFNLDQKLQNNSNNFSPNTNDIKPNLTQNNANKTRDDVSILRSLMNEPNVENDQKNPQSLQSLFLSNNNTNINSAIKKPFRNVPRSQSQPLNLFVQDSNISDSILGQESYVNDNQIIDLTQQNLYDGSNKLLGVQQSKSLTNSEVSRIKENGLRNLLNDVSETEFQRIASQSKCNSEHSDILNHIITSRFKVQRSSNQSENENEIKNGKDKNPPENNIIDLTPAHQDLQIIDNNNSIPNEHDNFDHINRRNGTSLNSQKTSHFRKSDVIKIERIASNNELKISDPSNKGKSMNIFTLTNESNHNLNNNDILFISSKPMNIDKSSSLEMLSESFMNNSFENLSELDDSSRISTSAASYNSFYGNNDINLNIEQNGKDNSIDEQFEPITPTSSAIGSLQIGTEFEPISNDNTFEPIQNDGFEPISPTDAKLIDRINVENSITDDFEPITPTDATLIDQLNEKDSITDGFELITTTDDTLIDQINEKANTDNGFEPITPTDSTLIDQIAEKDSIADGFEPITPTDETTIDQINSQPSAVDGFEPITPTDGTLIDQIDSKNSVDDGFEPITPIDGTLIDQIDEKNSVDAGFEPITPIDESLIDPNEDKESVDNTIFEPITPNSIKKQQEASDNENDIFEPITPRNNLSSMPNDNYNNNNEIFEPITPRKSISQNNFDNLDDIDNTNNINFQNNFEEISQYENDASPQHNIFEEITPSCEHSSNDIKQQISSKAKINIPTLPNNFELIKDDTTNINDNADGQFEPITPDNSSFTDTFEPIDTNNLTISQKNDSNAFEPISNNEVENNQNSTSDQFEPINPLDIESYDNNESKNDDRSKSSSNLISGNNINSNSIDSSQPFLVSENQPRFSIRRTSEEQKRSNLSNLNIIDLLK